MKGLTAFAFKYRMVLLFLAMTATALADPHPEGDNGGGVWHPFDPIIKVITWAFLQAVRVMS